MVKLAKPCPTIRYKGETLTVTFPRFHNGRIAIQLMDAEGYPYMRCGINVPEIDVKEDEVVIKDYSECVGMHLVLSTARIVSIEGKEYTNGNCRVIVCKLLVDADGL